MTEIRSRELLLITGNVGKFREASRIIPQLRQLNIPDLTEIQSTNPEQVITHKLRQVRELGHLHAVVEDTSLVLLDWGNGLLPGPYIKDFLDNLGPAGLSTLAAQVGNRASYRIIVGYIDAQGAEHLFEGELRGQIVKPRGTGGFGFDPSFQPDGETRTLAELTEEEKAAIGLRRVAFGKLREFLEQL